MPHPLELKLARLRRRARQFILIKAVARTLLLVLIAGLLLALLDAVCHFQDRGLRAIASLVLLTSAAVGLRWLLQAVRESRFSDVQIAQRVEQYYPQLRGRLASAIEFIRESEDDPLAGSVELRRATVRDAALAVDQLDLPTALDARPSRRALVSLGTAIAAAALLVALDGDSARIATVRLVNPLSDVEWPRVNQLRFVEPVERLPLGQSFEAQVVDAAGALLPDDVVMHYRYRAPDGEVSEETEPMQLIGGQLLARREGVQRPFEYRAVGGDDYAMPWVSLEVVEPPAVRTTSLTLQFPSYTGWPSRAGEPNLRAIVGTTVKIDATATKPLASAAIRFDDERTIPATLGADGFSVVVAADADPGFIVSRSGSYWFDLVDREGFRSAPSPKFEIRAVSDAPPTAEVEHPKANLFVTPDAVVPLEVRAADDLAIRRVTLDYLRSDKSDAGEQSIELDSGSEVVPADLAVASAVDGFAGDSRELSFAWDLKPLGLPPGSQVTFHASAVDYAAQTGQSLPRRLTIATPEEVQDRLADRQAVVFNELARVLQMQQTARSQVTGLQVQIDQTGKLQKSDIDSLQGAGLNQQQVERELTGVHDGLRGQIDDFLDELKINKIDGPDTQRQMQDVLNGLARLAQGPLPDAARGLTTATKAAQVDLQDSTAGDPAAKGTIDAALKTAATAQDEVVGTLSRMLDEMKQWATYRDFHREIGQLSKRQDEVANDTAALGRETLSRTFEDLDPQQRTDLQKLAQRQLDLARQLDRLEQRMEDSAAAVRKEDPLVADSMADALAHARGQGVAEGMHQAGRSVERNRIAQASQGQRKVAEELGELLDILSNRREHELGRLVKKLREAEQNLARLAEEQQGLVKKLKEAEQLPEAERRRELERLSKQERQLQDEAERFRRTLERLQADKAGASLAKAGAKMGQSAGHGESGDSSSAADQAGAAEQDLADAQQELAQQRRQAEVDLAQEQLARMEDAVASMHERQQKLIGETMHYQLRQADRGHLTRAEAASVREMANQQLSLRDELQTLANTLAGAEVFQFVLEVAGRDMTRAGERLDRRDVGNETLQAETSALARIEQLKAALEAEPAGAQQDESGEESGGGEGGGEGPQAKVHSVAELKLLKSIQEHINARTLALAEAQLQSSRLTSEQQTEFDALSEEQGRLADMVTNMMQTADERPEDDPDRLPDVREPSPTGPARDAPSEEAP